MLRHPAAAPSQSSSDAVQIAARVNGAVGELDVYGEIGFWGVTATAFKKSLRDLGPVKSIVVNVNSPGGDVFDGIAIYNDLLAHEAEVTVRVTGLAASAASLIAMAGDRVEIGDNAFLMIHNAWTFAMGDHRAMAETAAVLTKINERLAATYAAKSGKDDDEIREMMDAETWLDSGDAVEAGLADAVISADDADAKAIAAPRYQNFQNMPAALQRKLARSPEPIEARPAVVPTVPDPATAAALADLRALIQLTA